MRTRANIVGVAVRLNLLFPHPVRLEVNRGDGALGQTIGVDILNDLIRNRFEIVLEDGELIGLRDNILHAYRQHQLAKARGNGLRGLLVRLRFDVEEVRGLVHEIGRFGARALRITIGRIMTMSVWCKR